MPQTDQAIEIRREIIWLQDGLRREYRSFTRWISEAQAAQARADRSERSAHIPLETRDSRLRDARGAAQRSQDSLLTLKELNAFLREVSPDAPDVSAALPADIAAHLTEMREFLEQQCPSALTGCPASAQQSALRHPVSDPI